MTDPEQRRDLVTSAVERQNMWLSKQIEDIEGWIGDYFDVSPDLDVHPVAAGALQRIREVLQRPRPEHIGPPEMVHASFHWRDKALPDGLYEALPGDGYGFVTATDTKLSLQFDCGGVHACSDLAYERLQGVLAKKGWGLFPFTDPALKPPRETFQDGIIEGQRLRIQELDRKVKYLEKQNKWLEGKLYGEGDERDLAKVVVDRVEQYEATRKEGKTDD